MPIGALIISGVVSLICVLFPPMQVDRDAFMDTFGPYFSQKLKEAVDFLTQNTSM